MKQHYLLLLFGFYGLLFSFTPVKAQSDWINSVEGIGMLFKYNEGYNGCSLYSVKNGSGKLTIPSSVVLEGRTYKVTGILESAIADKNFSEIIVPNSVTTIEKRAFKGCINLKSLELPNVTTLKEYVFWSCTSLQSISLPIIKTISYRGTFKDCSSLTQIHIPNVTEFDGERTFEYCTSLTNLDFIPDKVQKLVCAEFSHCDGLVNITIPKGIKLLQGTFEYCNNLESVTLQEGITTIDYYAFYFCDKLKSINFPNSLDSISDKAFYPVSRLQLQDIYIPKKLSKFSPSIIFSGCNDIHTISVASGNNRFDSRNDCNALIETNTNKLLLGSLNTIIPNSVRIIGSRAFRCPLLTSITLPERLTTIENGAFSNTSLSSIIIPEYVSSIGASVFPTTLETIVVAGENATYDSRDNCNAIIETATNKMIVASKNTTIPQGVEILGDGLFSGFTEMADIVIPNSLKKIGSSAFSGCSRLQRITIPSSVATIGGKAFYNCINLNTITCYITEPTGIDESVFLINDESHKYDIYNNAILYVPKGTKQKYWNTAGWSRFENIVELEEEQPPVKLTAKSYEREYGVENPSFDYDVEEDAIITGEPVLSCPATIESPVGQYPIVISKGTVTGKVELTNGVLTITQAPLLASVGDYERNQGEANPEFIVEYEGFRNGDTESVLTTKPIVATVANEESKPGIYQIFIYGGEAQNYVLSYSNGSLTVFAHQGVTTIISDKESFNVYTITGVLVRKDVRSLAEIPSGIYVVNGKKIIK